MTDAEKKEKIEKLAALKKQLDAVSNIPGDKKAERIENGNDKENKLRNVGEFMTELRKEEATYNATKKIKY